MLYGIVLGSIISLGAIGVSLIYGILGFSHFAHGDMMTIGAYVGLFGITTLGLPLPLTLLLAAAATALLALLIDRLIYRRLRSASPIIMLISTIGVSFMLQSLAQIVWGPNNEVYHPGITLPYKFLGLRLQPVEVTIIIGSILLVALLHLFLHRTKTGKAMRAMSDNVSLSQITGINTDMVVIWTWIIAGILAAAAGVFLGADTQLNPRMGFNLLLPIFAAAILGGIGNLYGAILGGLIIGVAQEVSTTIFDPGYKPAIGFIIMVFMLLVRPYGILGGKR
ncbi:branched-chain amino acid ABC transporter permease [Salinispira pacifica]